MLNLATAAIGAVVGAAVGAAGAIVVQRARRRGLSWKTIVASTAAGLGVGATAGLTLGGSLVVAKAGGAVVAAKAAGGTAVAAKAGGAAVAAKAAGGTAAAAKAAGGIAAAAKAAGTTAAAAKATGTATATSKLAGTGKIARGALTTPKRLLAAYKHAHHAHPLLADSVTSGTLMGAGDIVAQKIEGREEIDWGRTGMMAGLGAVAVGPANHYWFKLLDGVIPGKSVGAVVSKVALDQVGWTPLFTSGFFVATGAMNGESPRQIGQRLRRDLWPTMKTTWMLWPIAHAINFRLLSPDQRVLYVSALELPWNAFLSKVGHGHGGGGGTEHGEEASRAEPEEAAAPQRVAPERAPADGFVDSLHEETP